METNKINPINVEIEVSYDYDLSQITFSEIFTKSELADIWQYTSYGEIELINKLEDLFTIKNNNRKFLIDWLGWTKDEAERYDKDDLRQEIIDQLNYEDLIDPDSTDGLIIERNFVTKTTRGYSQGDYAVVLIPIDKVRALWGTDKKTTSDEDLLSQKYIDNLFWDSPVWYNIEITSDHGSDITIENGEIENIPEYLNYPQDIDFINNEIIKYCKDKFKYIPAKENILKAIKDALPSEVKYPCSCSC